MGGWIIQENVLAELAYDDVHERTSLGSQHAILAIHQAAGALSGIEEIEELDEDYETSRPTFTSDTLTYDARSMTVFEDDTVSLSTVDDRIRCALALPDESDGYQRQYLDSDEWELTESTLSKRTGNWYLHLGFRKLKPDPKPKSRGDEDRTVLGVDLGIVNIATTSTAYVASGRELRHRHREFDRIRSRLQQTGTQSAHRTIRR